MGIQCQCDCVNEHIQITRVTTKSQLRYKDWGFFITWLSVLDSRDVGTQAPLGSVHPCAAAEQWDRHCLLPRAAHTHNLAQGCAFRILLSLSLSLPQQEAQGISESYLHTGITPLKRQRKNNTRHKTSFSYTDILSIPSCKVSLREAIPFSLPNLLVLTLSSQR